MEIFPSIEVRAARIPDTVARLRYLRSALRQASLCRVSARAIFGLSLACLSFVTLTGYGKQTAPPQIHIRIPQLQTQSTLVKSWLVEKASASVVYSNGLQIREDYTVNSTSRRFQTFSRRTLASSGPFTGPVGIVYHTTESLVLPMEAARNRSLVQTREDLLHHIREGRLYNFLIDRFGQVFRIVPEDQVAYHAGHSVWADRDSIYEGLNESFIGVSFEGRTDAEARTASEFEASAAQIRSGRLLTEILRAKFNIAESNCVTHAQVSVNPDNMRFGYHTDWGARFPFHDLGLSTGYNATIPAVSIFGFDYDDYFLKAIGGSPWDGLVVAQKSMQSEAEREGLSLNAYRKHLQQQYRLLRSHPHEYIASNRT